LRIVSPTRPSSRRRRKDGRKDATGDTESGEGSPGGERQHLTERRSTARRIGRRSGEGQRPEKAKRGIEKRKNVGPSDVRGRVWGSVGAEKNTVAEFDVVGGSSSEAVPEEPPAGRRVRKRSVVGMVAEEVAAAVAIRSTSRGS
jgi:hypothetical protein